MTGPCVAFDLALGTTESLTVDLFASELVDAGLMAIHDLLEVAVVVVVAILVRVDRWLVVVVVSAELVVVVVSAELLASGASAFYRSGPQGSLMSASRTYL